MFRSKELKNIGENSFLSSKEILWIRSFSLDKILEYVCSSVASVIISMK